MMQKIDRLQRRVIWMLINPDTGRVKVEKLNWKQAEPRKRDYHLEELREAVIKKGYEGRSFFLHIIPDVPEWSEDVKGDYAGFLKAVSEFCKEYPWIYSIDVTIPEEAENDYKEIADIYIEEFPGIYKMVCPDCEHLAAYICGNKYVGIILDSDKDAAGIGGQIAELKLQKVWEHAPVRMEGKGLSKDMLQNAVRWHVSAIETEEDAEDIEIAPLGFRPEVRHCYTVSEVKKNGKLPVKAWVVNSGNAPSYLDACFKIRLQRTGGDEELVWDTELMAGECYPGEDVLLETEVPVEGLPEGEYELQMGLFDSKTGYPISMGIEGRISDGFYFTDMNILVC